MKAIISLLLLISLVLSVNSIQAQLSKVEKKAWKTKAKEYKKYPERLKAYTEEHDALKSRATSLDNQLKALQAKFSEKDARIEQLTDENENMKSQLASTNRKVQELMAQPRPVAQGDDVAGLVFKVQIGAFNEDKGLTEYAENQKNFAEDKTEEAYTKYTLGVFRDYWEADKFKKYLRTMGVKQAWIVSYKDGTRVPIKDVLEGIIE